MDCSTPGFPVHHQLPEPTQNHVHYIGDVIQLSHPLLSLLLLPSNLPIELYIPGVQVNTTMKHLLTGNIVVESSDFGVSQT